MRGYSMIWFLSILFSVDSKFLNTKAVENYLMGNRGELSLNGMVGDNGVLNQEGSILQLALTHNG